MNVQTHADLATPTGVPVWTGVVMIERPDPTRQSHEAFSDGPLCLVRSARTIALHGARAVVTQLPYKMLQKYFDSSALDHVFVWAELHPGSDDHHLELRERASLKDWVDFSGPLSTRH